MERETTKGQNTAIGGPAEGGGRKKEQSQASPEGQGPCDSIAPGRRPYLRLWHSLPGQSLSQTMQGSFFRPTTPSTNVTAP